MGSAAPSAPRAVRSLAPLVVGFVAIAAGIALGSWISGTGNGPLPVDRAWAAFIGDHRGPVGDAIAATLNLLGGGLVGGLLVPLGVAVLLFAFGHRWGSAYFVAASIAGVVVAQTAKHAFERPRPPHVMVHTDAWSFPSGHTANAATLVLVLAVILPRLWVWAAGVGYVVLMAISRTYLSAHWLSDTAGGLLLGAGSAFLVWAAFARVLTGERRGL